MKFYAVIGERALEFRSVVAEKRFYEQRGKPVIIEIADRPSAEFRHEEHLCAQLADAERDAPHSVTGLIELVDVVRELKAELIAAHPTRLRDRSSRTPPRPVTRRA